MCKLVNIVLSWPIVSILACQSIDALSFVIITCVAIVLRFPDATELPAQPWDAALAILRSGAHYCLLPVLQAVLHELQVAGKRRREEGRSQIQHSVRRQCVVGCDSLTGCLIQSCLGSRDRHSSRRICSDVPRACRDRHAPRVERISPFAAARQRTKSQGASSLLE